MSFQVGSWRGMTAVLGLALLAACSNDNNPAMSSSNGGGSSSSSSSSSSGSSSSSSSSSSGSSSSSSSGGLSSSVYSITNLVADVAGLPSDSAASATTIDTKLVNPWGLAFGPTSPAWIANNGSQTSTVYDGEGATKLAAVTIPGDADPSGIVFNGGAEDFMISKAGGTAHPAAFIFDGEGGKISGWASGVDLANAVTVVTATDGAVYKGLALAQNAGASFLYATDFHNNKVDVFDHQFNKVSGASTFPFKDATLPAGYAPFGIAAFTVAGQQRLVVAYARQTTGSDDETDGAGLGAVDIYDTAGNLVKSLVAPGGALNAPWGLALAPADFGSASGKLLVGNFGDGKINAYDPATGAFVATLAGPGNKAIVINGLWALAFGNDASNLDQPHNTLFFTAGTNGEADGTYGRIDAGPDAPSFKPTVTLTAPTGTLKGTVTLSATASSPVGVKQVQFFANSAAIGTATAAPFSVQWDTTKVADGNVTLTAAATDSDSNVATSSPVTVSVSNAAAPSVSLEQVQSQIFTPICSGCHSGNGAGLPGVMNLTAGNSFANIVNKPSLEQSNLDRIKPNDPTNSYLVQKVKGSPGISGSRMPLGCSGSSCLSDAQINLIVQWVSEGAPNN